ncbi:MAG: hypothetical protein MJ249_05975 [Kiritimatiellae bacterium]|nr:hypothetical protein [Kiritimatiellia bacterium]
MSESAKHIELVEMIRRFAVGVVTSQYASLILVDNQESTERIRIGRYYPDVYFNYSGMLVIGEAKTLEDFSRKHSRDQFEAYLAACSSYQGEATLIVAVPWMLTATAKNYFRHCASIRGNTNIVIIEDSGRWCEL